VTITQPVRAERLVDFRATFLPALVSRLVCSALIVAVASTGKEFTLSGFTKWDGGWYRAIAGVGYGATGDNGQQAWPFFPLFPGMLRVIDRLGLPVELVGVLLVNLGFWVALAGVHRIARMHVSPRATTLAVWALALFPSSFVFSMLYPSSFFLAASVWAFVWVEERRDWAAAGAVLAAAMLRPNGVIVAIALGVALWRAPTRLVVVVAPAATAVVAWCSYCWYRTGDPLVFLSTKEGWAEVTLVGALTGAMKWAAWPHLILAIAAVGVVVYQRRRMPLSWMALTALQLLPSLVLGMVGLARYANECFPPFVAAGAVLDEVPRWLRIMAFVAAVIGLFLCTLAVIRYSLVP
jgi:hypothetical protein